MSCAARQYDRSASTCTGTVRMDRVESRLLLSVGVLLAMIASAVAQAPSSTSPGSDSDAENNKPSTVAIVLACLFPTFSLTACTTIYLCSRRRKAQQARDQALRRAQTETDLASLANSSRKPRVLKAIDDDANENEPAQDSSESGGKKKKKRSSSKTNVATAESESQKENAADNKGENATENENDGAKAAETKQKKKTKRSKSKSQLSTDT